MAAFALAAPILPGKVDTWKAFAAELSDGTRKDAMSALQKATGVTHTRCWLQPNPDGSHLAIVLHEGETPGKFHAQLATDASDFAQWFRSSINDIHGIDLTGPPPPDNELLLDIGLA